MVMQGKLETQAEGRHRAAFIGLKDPAILKLFRAEGFVATNRQGL